MCEESQLRVTVAVIKLHSQTLLVFMSCMHQDSLDNTGSLTQAADKLSGCSTATAQAQGRTCEQPRLGVAIAVLKPSIQALQLSRTGTDTLAIADALMLPSCSAWLLYVAKGKKELAHV